MKITGETMIFKNDKGYSITVSNKNAEGKYENMFIAVNFKRDIEVQNQTKINILDSFLTFYKNKEGLPKPKIMVMEFESINIAKENDFIGSESDLPF